MIKRNLFILTLAMGVAGIGAYAQNPPAQGSVGAADSQFMTKAAQGGLAEVQLGKLAEDKASHQAVKDFGERMVDDHSKANDQLKSLASQKNASLPDTMDAKDQALYNRLSKLSGNQFDREYLRAMVKDHEEDLAEFRKESRSARDPDVRAFASRTLPTLEEHLKLARDDSAKIGATAKK